MHVPQVSTRDELSSWLEEADIAFQAQEAARVMRNKQARAFTRATGDPSWEHQQFAFKVQQYKKAVNA